MEKNERILGFIFTEPGYNRDEMTEYELQTVNDKYFALFERRGFYGNDQVTSGYQDPIEPIAELFEDALRSDIKTENIHDDGRRFMRQEVGRYLEKRYAIYERGGTLKFPKDYEMDDVVLPNVLIFVSHDRKDAEKEWKRIAKLPIRERKTADIDWLDY